jgi:hypothetical protein
MEMTVIAFRLWSGDESAEVAGVDQSVRSNHAIAKTDQTES